MPVSDEQATKDEAALVAYLDGALGAGERAALETRLAAEPALKARLDLLAAGGRDFARAFDALFEAAPAERLSAMLGRIEAENRARARTRTTSARRRVLQLAAAIVLFALGGGAGFLLAERGAEVNAPREAAEDKVNWRAAVAEYLTLYTADTLAGMPEDEALKAKELAAVGAKLDLDLSTEAVALPDAELKRAQLFSFRNMPLAQIAYLSPRDGPLAFCVILNGKPDHEPKFEVREDLNIVFWNKDGRGYLVIGRAAREELEKFAGSLRARVS
jgi:anti-sigma factor RsiW